MGIFKSADEAKDSVGLVGNAGIYECCTGKKTYSAGFKWKYKEDVSQEIIYNLTADAKNQTDL